MNLKLQCHHVNYYHDLLKSVESKQKYTSLVFQNHNLKTIKHNVKNEAYIIHHIIQYKL